MGSDRLPELGDTVFRHRYRTVVTRGCSAFLWALAVPAALILAIGLFGGRVKGISDPFFQITGIVLACLIVLIVFERFFLGKTFIRREHGLVVEGLLGSRSLRFEDITSIKRFDWTTAGNVYSAVIISFYPRNGRPLRCWYTHGDDAESASSEKIEQLVRDLGGVTE